MVGTVSVRLGGLVLGSEDPDRLAEWYRLAFAPNAAVGTVVEFSTGRLIFDRRADLEVVPREPGRILLNFYVGDIRTMEAHLNTLGVEWVRRVERFGPGMIGTVKDADGNYVQVIELADGSGVGG
jgi:hypothetical protein